MLTKLLLFACLTYMVAGQGFNFANLFGGQQGLPQIQNLAQQFGGFGGQFGGQQQQGGQDQQGQDQQGQDQQGQDQGAQVDNNAGGDAGANQQDQQGQDQQGQDQQGQDQQGQVQQQDQGQQQGRLGRAVDILGRVQQGFGAAQQIAGQFGNQQLGNGLGRAGGVFGNIGNILGLFRAEGADGDNSVFLDEEATALALAELSDDELNVVEDALLMDEENFALLVADLAEEEALASLSEEELQALAMASSEDELALQAAMAAADTQNTASASASTPTWAVALIVLGALVGIALIVVQVQLVMLFRKRLPNSEVDHA